LKRGEIEILCDILEAISEEPKPTPISFRTQVPYTPLTKKLNYLVRKGLVTENTQILTSPKFPRHKYFRKRYFLTDSGKELLVLIRKLREILG